MSPEQKALEFVTEDLTTKVHLKLGERVGDNAAQPLAFSNASGIGTFQPRLHHPRLVFF